MKTLVFGTFDILHPGHEFFLRKAKSYGDELYVIVALDSTVLKVKGKLPRNDEYSRKKNLERLGIATRVMLGHSGDKLKVVEEIRPDVICLGYDQTHFTEGLEKNLNARGLHPKVIRIIESLEPEKYKSSKL